MKLVGVSPDGRYAAVDIFCPPVFRVFREIFFVFSFAVASSWCVFYAE